VFFHTIFELDKNHSVMNRTTKLILFVTLFAALASFSQNHCYAQGDDPIPIIIGEGGNPGGLPIFYAPTQIPIQAAYSSLHSTVFVNFLYDLGYVSVEIENLTTGEYSQTVVNALAGPMAFPISSSVGHWTITFTFTNGEVFYGEFDINYD